MKIKNLLFTIFLGALLLLPNYVLATAQEDALAGLTETSNSANLQEGDLPTTIGAGIGVLLSILGVVFLVIVIYGGLLWMTAGGEEAKVKKGKTMLIEGVVGLLICLSAYSFSIYVVGKITQAVGAQ